MYWKMIQCPYNIKLIKYVYEIRSECRAILNRSHFGLLIKAVMETKLTKKWIVQFLCKRAKESLKM